MVLYFLIILRFYSLLSYSINVNSKMKLIHIQVLEDKYILTVHTTCYFFKLCQTTNYYPWMSFFVAHINNKLKSIYSRWIIFLTPKISFDYNCVNAIVSFRNSLIGGSHIRVIYLDLSGLNRNHGLKIWTWARSDHFTNPFWHTLNNLMYLSLFKTNLS